jgi:antitoxin (DNA-binding transcriptional repressor) of toxin-antitoxin stability system
METVRATDLKNRLGEVLAKARLHPVAIERHGRVVAILTPVSSESPARAGRALKRRPQMPRAQEERLVDLCASGDLRPSRWLRGGNPRLLAGVAVMLASQPEFDRYRLLALAEQLEPGMARPENFGRWLEESPLRPARFLPMVRAQMRASSK